MFINSFRFLVIKALFCFTLLAIDGFLSWWLAFFWSRHDDSWLKSFPEFLVKDLYTALRYFLSDDVAVAEDQLMFLLFWIPSFVLIGVVLLLAVRLKSTFLKGASVTRRGER